MLKNNSDKKPAEISLSFENILICNEKKSRPFIEAIIQDPENVEQQNLGTLIGIFEVSDTSEDSSYIVNYLISIIKKEYFSKPRRGPVESFEMALHKANLALSKLAEHGNIGWIGKLNIVCAAFEKNKLHFAKCGLATAFLLRSKTLTDISEGLSEPEADPNPLKTFDNVSSGKLEAEDKIIITTDNIFEIFSLEEIKKSALRFNDPEFLQFLKTALGNELKKAATIIVDVRKKIPEAAPVPFRRSPTKINAFSQTAFEKSAPKPNGAIAENIKNEITEELEKAKESFTNKKTGHIYIKGADHPPEEKNYFSDIILFLKDFSDSAYSKLALLGKRSFASFRKKLVALTSNSKGVEMATLKGKAKEFFSRFKNSLSALWRKIQLAAKAPVEKKPEPQAEKPYDRRPDFKPNWIPSYARLKSSFAGLSYEQKLYAFLAIIAIFLVPYFGIKISQKVAEKNKPPSAQNVVPVAIPLEQDKNVTRIEKINTVYSGNGLLGTINFNGKTFAITDSEIADPGSGEKFNYPGDFGKTTLAVEMADLNLILAMNQSGQIISFGLISKKFQTNSIAIPEKSNIADLKTYLTYIYLLDVQNGQIYRYPRADGGFGSRADWLKDSIDLSSATGMAINENIFIADGQSLIKLFSGKKQDFSVEETATPIVFFKVYAPENSTSLYILDKDNSRIVKLDNQGKIIFQYYNSEMSGANDLSIDEKSNTAYFSTPQSVKSFKME